MNKKALFTLSIAFTLIMSSLYAQQGKNDTTFNTFDNGVEGEGFDGNVRVIIENLDETLFVAGDFLNFNGSTATRIIKLTSNGDRATGFTVGTGFNGSVVSGLTTLGGNLLYGGSFTNYNGTTKNYLARLNLDGTLDTTFNTSATGPNAAVQAIAQCSDGSIIVAGDAITTYNGALVNNVFKINANGALDTTFSANITVGTAGAISKIVVQPDGKILICGSFTSFNGAVKRGLTRLNADGTLDTSFITAIGSSTDNNILAMNIQPDGKIILGGAFTLFNGNGVGRIVRLNADGTLDSSFNNAKSGFANGIVQVVLSTTEGIYVAGSFTGNYNSLSASLNRFVLLENDGDIDGSFDKVTSLPSSTFYSIVKAIDGQVYLGGSFTAYDLTPRGRLAKISSVGALDTSFLSSGGVGANNAVLKVIPLPSGKSMIFGSFTTFNGSSVNRIARLNSDGSLDTTFNSIGTGASSTIRTVIQLSDGSFIIGGDFTSYNGTTRNRVAKINADGSLNTSFNPNCTGGAVYSIIQDSNGKILIGGNFTTVGGISNIRLARINSDGTVDTSFTANANGIVETIVIEPATNKIIVGGRFTSFNSTTVTRLVRMDDLGALDSSFNNTNGPNNYVYTLAFQSNGGLIVGGSFTNFGGVTKGRFLRLTVDGLIDSSFKSGTAFSNTTVRSIVIQPDDRILIGGDFNASFVGSDAVSYLVRRLIRLKNDGSFDTTFKSVLNNICYTIAIDYDGRIQIGGSFSSINGTAKHRVARLLTCTNQTSYTSSGWSRGTPDKKFEVAIESDLLVSSDIVWCNCSVATGNRLTIDAYKTLTLAFDYFGNGVTKAGKIEFLNSASLLQVDNNSINTGTIEYNRISSPMNNFDYTYWSSPVVGQTAKNVSPNTLADKYFKYNPTSGWVFDDGLMSPGVGYIIRTPKEGNPWPNGEIVSFPYAQPVTFNGIPNNGEIRFSVAEDQFNLIGNPYPSALDAELFMTNPNNASIIYGALYFWTHNTPITNNIYTSNDYAAFNITGGTGTAKGAASSGGPIPNGKIAAGQSFFIGSNMGIPVTSAFVFENNMRVEGNNSQFFKHSKTKKEATIEKNRLWLNLTNSQGAFKQLLVGYITGATNDWDNLYDGPSFDGQSYVDFYSINKGQNLTIQGRALPFQEIDEVPLGYRSTIVGNFDIGIDSRDGLMTHQEIWLEDKKTNTIHDLSKGKYTFTAINGIENDRFVLKYTNKTLGTEEILLDPNSLLVSVKNKKITLFSSKEVLEKVQVFDLLGRLVYSKSKINQQDWTILNLALHTQTLIVKTTFANGAVQTNKVIY